MKLLCKQCSITFLRLIQKIFVEVLLSRVFLKGITGEALPNYMVLPNLLYLRVQWKQNNVISLLKTAMKNEVMDVILISSLLTLSRFHALL